MGCSIECNIADLPGHEAESAPGDKTERPMNQAATNRPRHLETPDWKKAIRYYETFMGLIVRAEKDRFSDVQGRPARHPAQTSRIVRTASICPFEVYPNSDFGFGKELAKDGCAQRNCARFHSGMGQVLASQDDKEPTIELLTVISRKHEQDCGHRPLNSGTSGRSTRANPKVPSRAYTDIQRTVKFYEQCSASGPDWIGDSLLLMRCNRTTTR